MVHRRRRASAFGRRKWSMGECDKILDFIRRNPFEQPNGADYYRKMILELGVATTYSSMRSKVKHMLLGYNRAKDLLALRPDFPMSEVLQICPFYTDFREIFSIKSKLRRNTICGRGRRSSVCSSPTANLDMDTSEIDMSDISTASNTVTAKLSTPAMAQARPKHTFPQPIAIKQEPTSGNQEMSSQSNGGIAMPNIISVESISFQEAIPSQFRTESVSADSVANEINDINADSSTAPSSTETRHGIVDRPEIIDSQDNAMAKPNLKLMELRLREKELELKLLKIQSNERLVRFELESKERIKMKKLTLKYAKP